MVVPCDPGSDCEFKLYHRCVVVRVAPSVVAREAVDVGPGWKTLNAVFRVISNPPGLVGGFDVRTARGIGTGGRRGVCERYEVSIR